MSNHWAFEDEVDRDLDVLCNDLGSIKKREFVGFGWRGRVSQERLDRLTTALLDCAVNRLWLENVTAPDLASLARVVERSDCTLKHLTIFESDVSDFKSLGPALARNTSLESICFKDTRISDESVQELARGLKENTTVTHLSLAQSPLIGDASAFALLNLLESNDILQVLDLDNCCGFSFGRDGGAEALSLCAQKSWSLKTLKLSHCYGLDKSLRRILLNNACGRVLLRSNRHLAAGVWAEILGRQHIEWQDPQLASYHNKNYQDDMRFMFLQELGGMLMPKP